MNSRRLRGKSINSVCRLFAVFVGGLLLLFAVLLAGCHTPGRKTANGEIVVWITGDTQGYLEPCGCRRDQAGGLPARMTLVEQDKAPNRLLLDAGNITHGGRSYELLKFDYILRGMAKMHYDAVNLGKREVNLDRDTLYRKIAATGLPFVSCNVLDSRTSTLLTASTLVETVGGYRVGITGIVQAAAESVGPGLRVRSPEEALAETLPLLKKNCDFIIVLAFAPAETLHDIAAKFPEVGAVLGGDVPQSSDKAEIVNRAALFNVTDKGKVIGRLTFRPALDGLLALAESHSLKTADTTAPAPAMTELIKEFKATLRERNIELAAQEGLDPVFAASATTADTYAGEAKCISCHAAPHKITGATAHAHAYLTLQRKGSEYDPECLRCHTVGYGARDGFRNFQTTPQFANVQCESCHGRGTAHIAAIAAGKRGRAQIQPCAS